MSQAAASARDEPDPRPLSRAAPARKRRLRFRLARPRRARGPRRRSQGRTEAREKPGPAPSAKPSPSRLRHRNCARVYSVDRDERHVYVAYEYVRAARCARPCGPACSTTAARSRPPPRCSTLSPTPTLDASSTATSSRRTSCSSRAATSRYACSTSGSRSMDDADTLTAAGDVPGTLAYIAPERLAGEEATGAADVWAVGVILWEALAGQQPFWSASPARDGRADRQRCPPLAAARPDLPRALTTPSTGARARPGAASRPEAPRAELRHSVDEAERRREQRPAASLSAIREAGQPRRARRRLRDRRDRAPALLSTGPRSASRPPPPWRACRPTRGLALALAVPILPAGNVSLGLALVYLPVAVVWLASSGAMPGTAFTSSPARCSPPSQRFRSCLVAEPRRGRLRRR